MRQECDTDRTIRRVILIPRPMKLASVRAYLLSYPFPEPVRLPYWGGEHVLCKRDAMLIRVDTTNGLVGYAPGPGSERAQQVIQQVIGPFLVDRGL